MKLIVGLGNPGAVYENTYHNAGALAVRAVAGDPAWKTHKKLFSYAREGENVFVVPLVFMNDAGRAVKEAAKKFKAAPADIVIIHDESDLPVGTYKISVGRGAAGHKGVRSVMDELHSSAFTRVRIGIRDPAEKRRKKAEEFVLKAIAPRDRKKLEEVFAAL